MNATTGTRLLLRACATLSKLLTMLGCLQACKVPISDVEARFLIADASWFAEEQTLFVFYELQAQQGLGESSVLEVRYATDDGSLDWTPLSQLPQVHTHVDTDCGPNALCGSGSIRVDREPRDVAVRLRYHRDGALSLDANTLFNVVGPGPVHSHRSLLIYGVLDESNRAVQWRSRHRFPTIRNEEAQRLGLRRQFRIDSQWVAASASDEPAADSEPSDPESSAADEENPYLYGAACPVVETPLNWPALQTEERAIFNSEDLPSEASTASRICGSSVVPTAAGEIIAPATARKNPEVRPAFPQLRSPIRDATPIQYLLTVCERTISDTHLAMQRQRLQLQDVDPFCIDDPNNQPLVNSLVTQLSDDILRVRSAGDDMVLSIALHHDDPSVRVQVEEALDRTLSLEQGRASPRVVGAFVLDSLPHRIETPLVAQTAIWCPATLPTEAQAADAGLDSLLGINPASASLACAVLPDDLDFRLGPFSVGALPIFPSRNQYTQFLETYSEAQAGEVLSLTFRAPLLPPTVSQVAIPPLGVATFFNDEAIAAEDTDAFSFCPTDEYPGFVFRSELSPELAPIALLPQWHALSREQNYELGIVWEFPFLLRLQYQAVAAGAVSAFSASLPFGLAFTQDQNFGSELWLAESFSLSESLAQCRRFCDHPTFDSAGVYQVAAPFRSAYPSACYRPRYPSRGDTGFPNDP